MVIIQLKFLNSILETPKERPRLKLQPRTVDKPDESKNKDSQSPAQSIFGSAKPVDTLTKELEIEKKLTNVSISEKYVSSRKYTIFFIRGEHISIFMYGEV